MHNFSGLVAFLYGLQLRISEIDANLDAVSQEGRAARAISSNAGMTINEGCTHSSKVLVNSLGKLSWAYRGRLGSSILRSALLGYIVSFMLYVAEGGRVLKVVIACGIVDRELGPGGPVI